MIPGLLQEKITYEPPIEITPGNVMYWEEESKKLLKLKKEGSEHVAPYLSKARNFLENGCVVRIGSNSWKVLPIKRYNKTTRFIDQKITGFTCTCQGFKNNEFCSHILAVMQFNFMEAYNEK